jgi:hypothetical protein
MAKSDIKDFVCKPFCSFYREGAKEELICNGASLLVILMKRGMLSPEAIAEVSSGPPRDSCKNPALDECVCSKCPFSADDCDFQSKTPPLDVKPCGGYILMTLLATRGIISMESLKEIVDG